MSELIASDDVRELLLDYSRTSDERLTIILGAGASRGYSRDRDYLWSPPVVSELLNEKNALVSEVLAKSVHASIKSQKGHIERSIRRFDGDLEAYLSDLYKNDKEDDRFSAIVKYLEDIFATASLRVDLEDNHLQALLSVIRDLRGSRPWSIISFNYDTILEQSIASLPIFVPPRVFQADANYLNQNPRVLKMHGGVNLRYISVIEPNEEGRTSAHDVFSQMMGNSGPVESYLDTIPIKSPIPEKFGHRTFENIGGRIIYNFPLMMIPIHTLVRSENSFFGRQIEQAKADIAQSKLTIAIGYQFGDNHFVEALSNVNLGDNKLVLVGTKQLVDDGVNSRAYKQASGAWSKGNIKIYDGRDFASFVESIY